MDHTIVAAKSGQHLAVTVVGERLFIDSFPMSHKEMAYTWRNGEWVARPDIWAQDADEPSFWIRETGNEGHKSNFVLRMWQMWQHAVAYLRVKGRIA